MYSKYIYFLKFILKYYFSNYFLVKVNKPDVLYKVDSCVLCLCI